MKPRLRCDHDDQAIRDQRRRVLDLQLTVDEVRWALMPEFRGAGAKAEGGDFVAVEDVVAGCEGERELVVVWNMIELATANAVGTFTRRGDFDAIRHHVDTLDATCKAITVRLAAEGANG
jgi:hypothetical protein